MSDRPKPGDRLFTTRWVHLFEQDSPEGEVYAPEDGPIPLSRRPRERLELKPDGSAVVFGPGADDRPTPQPARWTEDDARARPSPGLWFAAANRRTIADPARRPAIGVGIEAVGHRDTHDPAKRKSIPAPAPTRSRSAIASRGRPSSGPISGMRRRHSYRPLRIYTLDPSVSDRIGGVATVSVPYEKLEPGPIGSLFKIVSDGAPAPLRAEALDLDDPNLLLSSGLSPSPANGLFHLQMVYAVCSLTYAAFRKALGREIAWATTPTDDGPLRLVVRPFGFEGTNAGYSREAGDLSFGYFSAGEHAAGFTLRDGLIATALSHDIVAHETTHALLDGLRSSFMDPSNVDVPAFHEAFSDLVALFLHFTYADVVERGIRECGVDSREASS